MRRLQRVAVELVGIGLLVGAGVLANSPTGWSQGRPAGQVGGPGAAVPNLVGPDGAVLSMREIVHSQ
jgi:hypothetical protein